MNAPTIAQTYAEPGLLAKVAGAVRSEIALARIAIGLVALHVADDNFLQPNPGTSDLAYLHVHPLAERLGEISFAATFPTAGQYRLFLQFKDAGRVQTAPLTLNVGRGH